MIVTILTAASAIVGGAAMLATLTPNKTDDKILQFVLDVINFLAMNFGKSENK